MLNRSLSPTALSYSNLSLASLHFANNAGSTNVQTGIMPSATDEVLRLRKDIRMKEADFTKEKAILQQKVEQLEQQLRDSKDREDQQRKLHETMINCLNANTGSSSGEQNSQAQQALAQLQAAEKQLQSEIQDLQTQKRRLYDELEFKDKEVKRQLADKDIQIKDSQIQMETMLLEKRKNMFQWEQEKKDLQQRLQAAQQEREQFMYKLEQLSHSKSNEQEGKLDRLKQDHQKELDRVKNEYEQNLKEIKYYHEQEKFNWQNKVERSTQELSSFIRLVKQRGEEKDQEVNQSLQMVRKKEEMEQEISQLQLEVENIQKEFDLKLAHVTQEKLTAENKALKLQKQLEKIKNAPKPVQIDLSAVVNKAVDKDGKQALSEADSKAMSNLKEEVQLLQRENEKLNDQVRKLRKEVLDGQDYTDRIEKNEKKLRQQLKDKQVDDQINEQLESANRQLSIERRRNGDLKEEMGKTSMKSQTLMLEKDQKITMLVKELRDTERKLSEIQSVFNSNQRRGSRNQSPFHAHTNSGGTNTDFNTHQRNISYSPIGQATTSTQNFMFPQQQHMLQWQQQRLSPRGSAGASLALGLNQSTLTNVPMQEGQMIMKQITQMEFTLLKTCQRMADQAIRMECSTCFQVFETGDFYDHIIQEHQQNNLIAKANANIANSVVITQSQSSSYQSGKQQTLISKRYAEDSQPQNSTLQNINILQTTSPKIKDSSRNLLNQQATTAMPGLSTGVVSYGKQKFGQNSRSFTCLLNEIEEEEKANSQKNQKDPASSSVAPQLSAQGLEKTRKFKHAHSKSPVHFNMDGDTSKITVGQKTRNMQPSFQTLGNTIQSVVEHQKQLKRPKVGTGNHKSTTSTGSQSLTVQTACRTEIQNLKRQNKKLNSKVQEQEHKLIDVSKDCSAIKKQVKHQESKKGKEEKNTNQLTTEIKGLLEQLVSIQGGATERSLIEKSSFQGSKRGSDYGSGAAFTSRQYSNMPMSTESMVELKSSSSSIFDKGVKKTKHRDAKSPMIQAQAQSMAANQNKDKSPVGISSQQHNSNKENIESYHRKASLQQQQTSVPRLNLNGNQKVQLIPSENHLSSTSSGEHGAPLSVVATERRYHQIKSSEDLCSNSPRRFQNYFEVLQSVTDSMQSDTIQTLQQHHQLQNQSQTFKLQNRYSPTNQGDTSKILSTKSLSRALVDGPIQQVPQERAASRNQPTTYNSKLQQQYTICSSQNNLVIYDSSNTDIFKSRQLKYYPAANGSGTHLNQVNIQGAKRLDFDDLQNNLSIEDSEPDNYQQCPSIEAFEENESRRATQRGADRVGIFAQSVDEDPFITGRFCDANGTAKQFLFKYSQNNSKNTTLREPMAGDLN